MNSTCLPILALVIGTSACANTQHRPEAFWADDGSDSLVILDQEYDEETGIYSGGTYEVNYRYTLYLYDVTTRERRKLVGPREGKVRNLYYMRSAEYIAVTTDVVTLISLTGEITPTPLSYAVPSRDGSKLADSEFRVAEPALIAIYDTASLELLTGPLDDPTDYNGSIYWTEDGELLITRMGRNEPDGSRAWHVTAEGETELVDELPYCEFAPSSQRRVSLTGKEAVSDDELNVFVRPHAIDRCGNEF